MVRTRIRRLIPASLALGLCLIAANSASAQQNLLFGSQGALGGNNGFGTGSTGVAPNAGQINALGGFGAAGTAGAGGTGGMGAGMQLGGQSGLGGTGMMGGAGQQRQGFVGRDDTANRFVGSSVAGAQGGAGQQGRNGLNQRNQMNRNQQGQNRNRGNARNQQFMNQGNQNLGGNQGQQQQRTIRPRQKVAFTYPAMSQTKLQTALNTRFDKLSKRAGFEGIEIVADGDRVTLRGQVDNEDTRKLAAMLASIEPGVSTVANELTVRTPEPPEPVE